MELRGDRFYEGGHILLNFGGQGQNKYEWNYYIGLSLWTGQWLYFKNGVDFACGAKAFRAAAAQAARARGLEYKASWKDMPIDELKVVWYPRSMDPAYFAPKDVDLSGVPDVIMNDPEFRKLAGLD